MAARSVVGGGEFHRMRIVQLVAKMAELQEVGARRKVIARRRKHLDLDLLALGAVSSQRAKVIVAANVGITVGEGDARRSADASRRNLRQVRHRSEALVENRVVKLPDWLVHVVGARPGEGDRVSDCDVVSRLRRRDRPHDVVRRRARRGDEKDEVSESHHRLAG